MKKFFFTESNLKMMFLSFQNMRFRFFVLKLWVCEKIFKLDTHLLNLSLFSVSMFLYRNKLKNTKLFYIFWYSYNFLETKSFEHFSLLDEKIATFVENFANFVLILKWNNIFPARVN